MEYALFMNHMKSYHEFKKIVSVSYQDKKSRDHNHNKAKKQKKKHNASKSSHNLSTFFRPTTPKLLSFASSVRVRSNSSKSHVQKRIDDLDSEFAEPPPFMKSVSEGITRNHSMSHLNSTKHSYAKRDTRNKNNHKKHRIAHPNYQSKSGTKHSRHSVFTSPSFDSQSRDRSPYACVHNTHKSKREREKELKELKETDAPPKYNIKRCKSCKVLRNETDAIRTERDTLQQKLTHSIHALVLQKELVRKQNIELQILRSKVQRMYCNNQPSSSSPSHMDSEKENEGDEYDDEEPRMFSFPLLSLNDVDDHKDVEEERINSPGAAPYGKRLSVNLQQSVTTVVDPEEEEKSTSSMMRDLRIEHDEEYVVMEGKEGVAMTNCENNIPSPLRIESVFSLDGGIDDDLLLNLHQNTPTPLSATPYTDFDEKSTNDDHDETQRWKVFESSEFAQLFCVLRYRTYCYCQREKRTSLILKQMISNDDMYLMKMEELHSAAITEELDILKPIFHIETLSNFLRNLIETENDLDRLFVEHQESHDIIYKSSELHLRSTGILCKTEPVFNWYISDYQQMWIYQELFYNNFEAFLVNICTELHNANIYCCHKDDFDDENRYKYGMTSATSMISKYKRTKQNMNEYYANTFGADFNKRDTVFCSPKNPSRSFFKVFYDFDGNVSHLTDFLRASFVFDNFEDLYNALFVINDFCGILKFKNSFLSESKLNNGWRQIIVNVPLCCDSVQNYIICEIQLHFCLFWQFKDATHRMYEISRLFKIRDHNTGKTRNLAMQCAKQFYSK
eukprot:495865_1